MASPLAPQRALLFTLALASALALTCASASGCSDDSVTPDSSAGGFRDAAIDARWQIKFGGSRPVVIKVPRPYIPTKPLPLVLVLHGYSANGWTQEKLFGYDQLVDKKGIILASPDGTLDNKKALFWNATKACCDFDGKNIDDSTYLKNLVTEISSVYNVNPNRIYAIGHSNGGFMAFRLACDHSDTFAAVISLAGSTYNDKNDCKPKKPISIVQMHGTTDDSIKYKGGNVTQNGKPYPGAEQIVSYWAGYDGCKTTRTKQAQFPTANFAEQTWKFFDTHHKL